MTDVIGGLKTRARALHRRAREGDGEALERLGAREAGPVLRREALAAVARELGFAGWSHASAAIRGEHADHGTWLYPPTGGTYWNVWCKTHEEARAIRDESDGYLLAYRGDFFVCDRYFIEAIGLDPDDEDWARIERDWAKPADRDAYFRLVERLATACLEGERTVEPHARRRR